MLPWRRKNGSLPELIQKGELATNLAKATSSNLVPTNSIDAHFSRRVTVVDRPGQDKAHYTSTKPAPRAKKKQTSKKTVVGFGLEN
uniref:Uncharacterized protein n=1 Tax=Ditylenchus dipsaci TaxID=166011 RepID=A0A915E2L3_9BILA